ncbi:MAG: hypothetical protein FWF38_02765 [Spirochaetaceae bacterium]|nr:hypothetical protein [Spirochaetaceae bacterium]
MISCTNNSSLGIKGAISTESTGYASAEDSANSKSDTAIKIFPKSYFSPKEMELFYNNVSGKNIISGNKKYLPVTEHKRPVFVACDCNNNGNTEFFVLFAESISESDISDISIDSVKDLRNIYMEEISLRQFLLAVYKYHENGEEKKFIHDQNIFLEDKGAFSSLKEIEIDKNNKIYGISINFLTSVGMHEDIVIKRKGSYSINSIKNTLSDSTRKEDIDGDGVIDLLRYEKIFVDGFGVETFITWQKFNGDKFVPVKTVNTVKDLRSFLNESKLYLEAKRIDLFIKKAVAPPVLNKLNLANISSEKILQRIFYPVKRESSHLIDINTMLSSSEDVVFIFPEIFENPFRMDNDGVNSFTTYVRVLLKNDGITIPSGDESADADNSLVNEEIYLVKIYMSNNPFEDNRFFFFVY